MSTNTRNDSNTGSSSRQSAPAPSHQMTHGKIPFHLPTLFVCLAVVLLATALITFSEVDKSRDQALQISQVYSARIESMLDGQFNKTDILEAVLVAQSGEMSQDTFDRVAEPLFNSEGVRCIQLLPDGTVTYVYPLKGNEAAVGGNVFENPKRRDDAILARDTKEMTLSGPYSLTQGGLGMAARNPVFLSDASGNEYFWGFTVVILDLPDALSPVMLNGMHANGYRYSLFTESDTGEKLVIDSTGETADRDPVSSSVRVPNHEWTLEVVPESGWVSWPVVALELAVGILLCLAVAFAAKLARTNNAVLRRLADTDGLTGLYNRRWFSERVQRRCEEKQAEPFRLFYLDLNGFKTVNDTLGHDAGDELLAEVARRLAVARAGHNLVARVGGDEFCVASSGNHGGSIESVEDLRKIVNGPTIVAGQTFRISASIGCARFPEDGTSYEELSQIADARMYEDKRGKSARD